MEAAGRVRRLTAAVVLNYRRTGEGKQANWQPRTADDMKRITDLAQAAIGFDASRGDQVSVEELAFDDDVPTPEPALGERVLGMANRSASLLRYGTILAAMLAFVFLVARPALRSLASAPVRAVTAAPSTGSLRARAAVEIPQLTPEQQAAEQRKARAQNVFDQVSENVKRDPAQTTRLLESWIRSE
jgi:flagellar M-ring protein FliF